MRCEKADYFSPCTSRSHDLPFFYSLVCLYTASSREHSVFLFDGLNDFLFFLFAGTASNFSSIF